MSGVDVDLWKQHIRSNAALGGMSLKVASVLADRFNGSGSCQLTAEEIADAAQLTCDINSVRSATKRLRQRGFISITTLPDSEQRGVEYRPLLPQHA
jgi:hypothetical protein